MSANQFVSVAMSVYREPIGYVREAAESVLHQTYENLELVVVLDDPDNSEAREYLSTLRASDSRVRVLVNESNMGLALSLNRAISASSGPLIARMDADDVALPGRIEREVSCLIDRDLDVIACAVDKIDENGLKWGEVNAFSERAEDVAALLPIQNVLVHPTVVFRREAVESAGLYRNFPSCQDYDLWLRLVDAGARVGILDERLLRFRRHPGSITATRRFGQIACESYIRELHGERLRTGVDSFSEEALRERLSAFGVFDERVAGRENALLERYANGVRDAKRGHPLRGALEVAGSLRGRAVRKSVSTSVRSKLRRAICRMRG